MIVGHHRLRFVVNRGLFSMLVRLAIVLAGMLVTVPAFAGPMSSDEARRFVIGKLFSFNCFEGTSGAGRVHPDGSVSGIVRFGGASGARYVTLPPGTLRVRGEAVCGLMGGMETCFDLYRTDVQGFRGASGGLRGRRLLYNNDLICFSNDSFDDMPVCLAQIRPSREITTVTGMPQIGPNASWTSSCPRPCSTG